MCWLARLWRWLATDRSADAGGESSRTCHEPAATLIEPVSSRRLSAVPLPRGIPECPRLCRCRPARSRDAGLILRPRLVGLPGHHLARHDARPVRHAAELG